MAGTDIVADRSRRARARARLVSGGIVGAVGTLMAVGPMGGPAMIFAGVGYVIAATGVRSLWIAHLLGTPTLTVPPAEPLALGGVLVARYRRAGGRRRARRDPEISAELVCTEVVTYRRGTDTHTVRQEVYRSELACTRDPAPDTVAAEILVRVPIDVPPSLTLPHNVVAWTVEVTVRVTGVPDDVGRFPVPVVPALAAAALGEGPAASPWGSP